MQVDFSMFEFMLDRFGFSIILTVLIALVHKFAVDILFDNGGISELALELFGQSFAIVCFFAVWHVLRVYY